MCADSKVVKIPATVTGVLALFLTPGFGERLDNANDGSLAFKILPHHAQ